MTALLLCLSILLSTGRNLLSKKLSDVSFGTRAFYLCQVLLFLGGSASVFLSVGGRMSDLAPETLLYAVIYAFLLLCAQWFYTAALSHGSTALCSTVYALGFIIPTLAGALVWSEPFSVLDLVGLLCAISAVIASGTPRQKQATGLSKRNFLCLSVAMLASGGLGVMQKMQQRSAYAEQRASFLLTAFLLAAVISVLFALFTKKSPASLSVRKGQLLVAPCIGIFFGCCNLINVILAARLESAVLFPVLNIGVILLSIVGGALVFKEKTGRQELTVLLLGTISILLLCLG